MAVKLWHGMVMKGGKTGVSKPKTNDTLSQSLVSLHKMIEM